MYYYVTHFNRQFGYFIICSNYKFPCWQLDNHLVPHLALCCYTISLANPHQPRSAPSGKACLLQQGGEKPWMIQKIDTETSWRRWSCAGWMLCAGHVGWGSDCKTSSRWAGPWYGLPGILFRHIPRYSSRLSGETCQQCCFARNSERDFSGFFEAEKNMATSTWLQHEHSFSRLIDIYFTIRIIQNINQNQRILIYFNHVPKPILLESHFVGKSPAPSHMIQHTMWMLANIGTPKRSIYTPG